MQCYRECRHLGAARALVVLIVILLLLLFLLGPMEETNAKCFNVKDFMSLYYNEEKIISFWQKIRLLNTRHEDDMILESCT